MLLQQVSPQLDVQPLILVQREKTKGNAVNKNTSKDRHKITR